MSEEKTKKEEKTLTDEVLDDVAGGANLGILSTPGILSQGEIDDLVQKVTGPDAPKPKLTSTVV